MLLKDLFNLSTGDALKKYSQILKLGAIAMSAYLCASIVNSKISTALKVEEVDEVSYADVLQTKIAKDKPREYYDIIIDRNIFDSTNEPVPGGKKSLTGDDALDLEGPMDRSNLPIKLIGTIVLNSPKWSIAVITGGGKEDSNVYKIQDMVLSSAIIIAIKRNKVIMKNNGRLEYVLAEEEEDTTGFVAQKEVGDVQVKELADGKYYVNKRELEQAFSDLSTILTQARVVPHFEDGKAVGFRIFAIQPGSIYSKLGLKDHDIIYRVNGTAIDDPMKGMQLFNSLKTESHIELDIGRDGVKKTHSYDIRN